MRYQSVTILPEVFFDSQGNVKKELVEEILNQYSTNTGLSLGNILKQILKLTKKKNPVSPSHRLDIISDLLPKSSFRARWYKKSEQGNSSTIKPFFNLVYFYLIEKFPVLKIENMNLENIIWEAPLGKVFLKGDQLHKIIDIAKENQISDEMMALYLWAFLEAHLWNDVGSDEVENYDAFRTKFEETLKNKCREDLLKLCLATDKVIEDEPISEERHSPSAEQNNTTNKVGSLIEKEKIYRKSTQPYAQDSLIKIASEHGIDISILETYRSLNSEVIDAKNKVQELNEQSLYDELERHLPIVRDLESKHSKLLKEIQEWLEITGNCKKLFPPPGDILISRVSSEKFLQEIESVVRASLKIRQDTLLQAKKELEKTLQVLEINIPKAFDKISTIDDLKNLKETLKPEIQIATVIKEMVRSGFNPELVEEMSQENHIHLYKRLLAMDLKPSLLEALLKYMISENNYSHEYLDKQISVIIKYAEALLDYGSSLPPFFWAKLKKLSPDDPFKKIINTKFTNLLKDEGKIDIVGLEQIASGMEDRLPSWLVERIELHRLLKTDPGKRLTTLTERLRDNPLDENLGIVMVRTLSELNHFKEAIFLTSIGTRIGWKKFDEEMLGESLLYALLESEDKLTSEKALLRELFEDLNWLLGRTDYILVFLYLVYVSCMEDVYLNFKYKSPEVLEPLLSKHPSLTNKLIELNESNFIKAPVMESKTDLLMKGKNALKKFEEAIEKPSCYSNWAPSYKYQKSFRKYLQDMFQMVKKYKKIEQVLPEEILEKIRIDFDLGEPKGDAAKNMRRYLEEQMERLVVIADALKVYTLKDLRKSTIEEIQELEREFNGIPEESILWRVYKKVIRC